jgi:NMD protein affecting ribosome stability and mRNA decay
LRIPPDGVTTPDQRGGKDQATWQSEFTEAHDEVRELEGRIAETQEKLREMAPEDWAFTPTGGGVPSDPEILKLRANLRRDRQSLEAARQRLRELQVEASLAGVPESWKAPPEQAE